MKIVITLILSRFSTAFQRPLRDVSPSTLFIFTLKMRIISRRLRYFHSVYLDSKSSFMGDFCPISEDYFLRDIINRASISDSGGRWTQIGGKTSPSRLGWTGWTWLDVVRNRS